MLQMMQGKEQTEQVTGEKKKKSQQQQKNETGKVEQTGSEKKLGLRTRNKNCMEEKSVCDGGDCCVGDSGGVCRWWCV